MKGNYLLVFKPAGAQSIVIFKEKVRLLVLGVSANKCIFTPKLALMKKKINIRLEPEPQGITGKGMTSRPKL